MNIRKKRLIRAGRFFQIPKEGYYAGFGYREHTVTSIDNAVITGVYYEI